MYETKLPNESYRDHLVAMDRYLFEEKFNWSLLQHKLFIMCLTQINWESADNDCVIILDKKQIKDILGLNYDSNHLGVFIREQFDYMMEHCEVRWQSTRAKSRWKNVNIITTVWSDNGVIAVRLNSDIMMHLEELEYPFVTVWANDVYGFTSINSLKLFNQLRLYCDTSKKVNTHKYSTKALKEIFGLTKDDYVNKKTGKFQRSMFEKRVLMKAIEEINKGQMIRILPFEDGSYFKKDKVDGKVIGYEFRYEVCSILKRDKEGKCILVNAGK